MIRSLSLASLFLAFVSFSSAPAQAKMVEVTGIGVNVDLTDGHLIIQGLIKDAPAEKSGLLMAKDEITAVKTTPTSDFVSVVGKTMDDAGALIRGAEGVQVEGGETLFEVAQQLLVPFQFQRGVVAALQ